MAKGLISSVFFRDLRSNDSLKNVSGTRGTIIQNKVVMIEAILGEQIEFQRLEQSLLLILRKIQQEFADALAIRPDHLDLFMAEGHSELVE